MSSLSEYELQFIRAGIEQLETYLLTNQLYYPIGISSLSGYPPYPPLTIGNLLLADRKAHAITKDRAGRIDLQSLESKLERVASQWGLNWENKSVREFQARLTLWNDYLQEYQESPSNNYDRYKYEVRRRVILQLIQTSAKTIPISNLESLASLDSALAMILIEGDFIWENNLAVSFPKEVFWFLYGYVPSQTS